MVVVSGAVANKLRHGGEAWVRLSYVLGLRRLGYRVHFIEQIDPATCVDSRGVPAPFETSANRAFFNEVMEAFDLKDCATLLPMEREGRGAVPSSVLELAEQADALVNISGHLTTRPLLERFRKKIYIDIDPGFTQFWHVDPETPFRVEGHDFYFTIGENIGKPGCSIPTGEIAWRPTRQPVVLEQWASNPSPLPLSPKGRGERERVRFTTIASWRGPFGPVQFGGRTFGLKVHEFRKFVDLPRRCDHVFEIALNIHPADEKDLNLLREHDWRIVDPNEVAAGPFAFRRYIEESAAEFSVAQGVYVETNSGWFSDRTVRYLAAGKPVLVQETGFSENYPVGDGLVSFRTLDEAVAGAERIARDYDRHCRAARRLAEEYFDSYQVLGRLMKEIGVEKPRCPRD